VETIAEVSKQASSRSLEGAQLHDDVVAGPSHVGRLGVDVKVIPMPPCILCIDKH
jgi:hypothetical protein